MRPRRPPKTNLRWTFFVTSFPVPEMTQRQRAAALGITPRQLREDERRGCPRDLNGARRWRSTNVVQRVRSAAGELGGATLAHAIALGAEAWNAVDALEPEVMTGADCEEMRRLAVEIFSAEAPKLALLAPLLAHVDDPRNVIDILREEAREIRQQIGRRARLSTVPDPWAPRLRRPAGAGLSAARAWLRQAFQRKSELRADLRAGVLIKRAEYREAMVRSIAEAAGELRGMGGRLAHEVAAMSGVAAIAHKVREEVDQVVKRLDERLAGLVP